MSAGHWKHGEVVVRRERLGLLPGGLPTTTLPTGVWEAMPVFIVADDADRLVSYIASGAQFGFPAGTWPTADGRHPWANRTGWSGIGCLMVQRPGEHHAIWHFWDGPERTFRCWYLNIQTAFVRTEVGYDTQDLELDIVVAPDGSYAVKDDDVMDDRIADGRFDADTVAWIRDYGRTLTNRLDTEGPWWDRSWASWAPPPRWVNPTLPAGWSETVDDRPTGS
ncbi:MAG: DUF402 domain-containing protein [Actinomycetota bacterium]